MSKAPGDQASNGTANHVAAAVSLTVIILARDVEECLAGCLESVAGWHSVVVALDSRTSDTSRSIAEAAGAIVQEVHWQGSFAQMRNQAAALAHSDWVFFLDADETVDEELKSEIDQTLSVAGPFPAYSLPRINIHFGRRLRHGGWWPDRQTRLLNRLEASFEGAVHEHVDVPASSVGDLQHSIRHHTHDTVAEVLKKADEYSAVESAEATAKAQPKPSAMAIVFQPLWHFLRRYVFQMGLLDGQIGLIEARLQAYYRHLLLIRRRERPQALPFPMFRWLVPRDPDKERLPVRVPPLPRDVLSVGFMVLLIWLPFHLVVKRVLPEPLGESWKEVLVVALLVAGTYRLRTSWPAILRNSWMFRIAVGYVVLVTLDGLRNADLRAGLDGIHVDVTYMALAVVILAMPAAERFPAILWSTVSAGVACALGAAVETTLGYPLFPSTTLLQQYGNASVYINATHILRPYFTFDFPTGLGAYLAVGFVLCAALWLATRQLWAVPLGIMLAVGVALTFSRGPWIGAFAGLAILALFATGAPLALRLVPIGVGVIVLVLSAVLTSNPNATNPNPIVLHTSSRVRTLVARARHETSSFSFLKDGRLAEREGLPAPTAFPTTTSWTFGNMTLPVLAEPPPRRGRALLAYRVNVSPHELLAFGIALSPQVWRRNHGDGVTFRVAIGSNVGTTPLFARYIDPKNFRRQRRPYFFRLPLFRYAGQTILVELTTDQGPVDDSSYDWSSWLNPRLVTIPRPAMLDHWPYAQVPTTMVERPMPAPGPYLDSFVNWQGDESNSDRVGAWQRTWDTWLQSPLLGHGPGSVDQAAVQARVPHPLITESQLGKVLVETGIVGFALWIALCALGLWFVWRAYRRRPELDTMAVMAALTCVFVCGLAFQVLEVKQIAAIFWSLTGCAVVAELALSGIEVEIPTRDIINWLPEDAVGRILEAARGWRFPMPPLPVPAPAFATAQSNGLGSPEPQSYMPVSDPVIPIAQSGHNGLGSIAEVFTTSDDTLVNEKLALGWSIVDVQLSKGKASFILVRHAGIQIGG